MALVFAGGSPLTPTGTVGHDSPSQRVADRSLEEVFGALREADAAVKSLRMTIQARAKLARPSGPSGLFFHQVSMVSGPSSYAYASSHPHGGLSSEDDPLREFGFIHDGVSRILFPHNRECRTAVWPDNEGLPGTLREPIVFMATGLWPLSGRKPPRPFGKSHMICEFTRAPGYRVLPEQELVGGRWCHVLVKDTEDVLSVDVERGVILRRDIFAGEPPVQCSRYIVSQHSKYGDNTWLPKLIENIQFDWQAPDPKYQKRRVIDSTIDVAFEQVNTLAPSDFVPILSPGTLQVSLDKDET